MSIFFILIGLMFIAKHQFEILRYRYKRSWICPEKIFPTGPQSYRLTKLAEEYPERPTVFIPLLACWIKRPLYSEIVGGLIISGVLLWTWDYSTDFPLILSIALGGVSWIFITKFAMTIMLKLCDYPSNKLVLLSMMAYPILLGGTYGLLLLLELFNICNFTF